MEQLPKVGDLLYCPYKQSCYGYSIVVKIASEDDKEFKEIFGNNADVIIAWPLGSKIEPGQRLYKGRYYNIFSAHSYVASMTKIIASLEEP